MKILYVTDAWHGFYEAVFKGASAINGLPSFGRVLETLVKEENDIDFIIINNGYKVKLNIGLPWLRESQVLRVINYNEGKSKKLCALLELIQASVSALKKKDYDFVYAHGLVAGFSIFAARMNKVPFGQRLYGTFLWDEFLKNSHALDEIPLYKKYYNIIAYRYRKAFLLVTNDGSHGDLVFEKICKNKSKYEFKYWVNGVKRITVSEDEAEKAIFRYGIQDPFIFYPARFDRWKNQVRILRILKLLNDEGITISCYFAGAVTIPDYYAEVITLVDDLDLRKQVHFLGNLCYQDIVAIHGKALASLALYDVCNFTNVFHEMMASGAVTIVQSDGIVDDIIIQGINGFVVKDNDAEVVSLLRKLYSNKENNSIRLEAIQTSRRYIKCWENRIDDEIQLIRKYTNMVK